MADSYIDYGTGGTLTSDQKGGLFTAITFEYLSATHFEVVLTKGTTGVKTTLAYADTDAPFAVTTTPDVRVQLDFDHISGYTALVDGAFVRIQRGTPIASLQRTFSDGSVLKASDLNAQTKQLLFGLQENVDQGIGSLPLDTDLKFDASDHIIKNLKTPESSSDAVTKQYVDNVSVYGSAFGGVTPQAWSFDFEDGTTSGSDEVFVLTDAISDEDHFYIVEVGGVLQAIDSYNVTVTGSTYSLTLLAPGSLAADTTVRVRNFGVSRNLLQQPFTTPSSTTTDVGMVVRAGNADQTGDMLQIQDSSEANMVSVGTTSSDVLADTTVELTVGDHAANQRSSRITDDKIITGVISTSSETSYGVMLHNSGGAKGLIQIQAPDGIVTSALDIYEGATPAIRAYYNGQLDVGLINSYGILYARPTLGDEPTFTVDNTTGNVFADGYLRLGTEATVSDPGDLGANDGKFSGNLEVGGGYGSSGLTIDSNGALQTNYSIRSDTRVEVAAGATGFTCSTDDEDGLNGGLWFPGSGAGPILAYDRFDSSGHPYVQVQTDKVLITKKLDMNSSVIEDLATPTETHHAVNKAYADVGRWVFVSTASFTAGGTGVWTDVVTNAASYDEVRIEFEALKATAGETASRSLMFRFLDDDGTPDVVPLFSDNNEDDYTGGSIEAFGSVNIVGHSSGSGGLNGDMTVGVSQGRIDIRYHKSTTRSTETYFTATHTDDALDTFIGTEHDMAMVSFAKVSGQTLNTLQMAFGNASNGSILAGFQSGTVTVYGRNNPTS